MAHLTGVDRHQSTLFPEVLDDYIAEGNQVRFIDAYVESLDLLTLGFTHADAASTGRPPYRPADLLKLYIYGYLEGTRSSRRLEQLTKRNVEVIWLLGRLQPDYRTIADFRKNNLTGLERVFTEFTLLCKQMRLFDGALVGIDGSKFSAVNHNSRHYTQKKLKTLLERIEAHIGSYLTMLDTTDQDETSIAPAEVQDLKEKIGQLQKRREDLLVLQEELTTSGASQMACTDPDSRMMRASTGRADMSYNVQIAVDAKHSLIVTYDVLSDVNDRNALFPMAQAAKGVLEADRLTVTADMGYFNEVGIAQCEDASMICHVAVPPQPNGKQFAKAAFVYDATADAYTCPAGSAVTYVRTMRSEGKQMRVYEGTQCSSCPLRSQCTRSAAGNRQVTRWEREELIEEMRERMRREPAVFAQRKCLVEHPFGTLKRAMHHGYFLMKGREKVRTEMALSALTYNMKRVLAIVGMTRLIEAIRSRIARNHAFIATEIYCAW